MISGGMRTPRPDFAIALVTRMPMTRTSMPATSEVDGSAEVAEVPEKGGEGDRRAHAPRMSE